MMRSRAIVSLLYLLSTPLLAQPVTLSGSVRDLVSLAPLDSVRIDIASVSDPAEHYAVFTNPQGLWSFTVGIEGEPELPSTFSVEQNYPNPFNPSTKISFTTHSSGEVVLTVHNILGQLLDRKSVTLDAGSHTIDWSSKGASGVLFYSVESGGERITRKMIQLDGHGGGGWGMVSTSGGRTRLGGAAKRTAASYDIIATKFVYMPDTAYATGSGVIDFQLETVHHHAFVFDLHNDVMEKAILGYQIGIRHTVEQSDIPRFRDGGVDAQMFALWTDWRDTVAHPAYTYTLQMADTFYAQVNRSSAEIAQARSSDDLRRLLGEGKMAGVLAIEGGHAIENDIGKLKTFYALGARYLTITWNNSTSWAVSAADARSASVGLSEFGRVVVRTLDSLGMLIDVSHTGIKTIWDILATTKNPIIATHSGARALNNHYRNLTDAQIDSIAGRGGVIGIVFYPTFLSASRTATIDTVIRHIDYIRNRAGVNCIAIGSDFDGIETVPLGLEDVSKMPNLTGALLRRGYTIEDVHKILGGNVLRVFTQVCR
jgi:membrane dipeptidase